MKRFHLTGFATIIVFLFGCETEPDPVVISSFEPTSGDYGAEIIIRGSQFTANSSIVKFGALGAEVISASATELVVTVPVGATTGKISVEANGQQVRSNEVFTVTAGTWQKKADFAKPWAHKGYDGFFTVNNTAYVHLSQTTVSGTSVEASFWAYDPSTNSWTQKKELSKDFSATQGHFWGTSSKGYLLQYSKLWEYDPISDQWTLKKPLPLVFSSGMIYQTFYISSVNRAYVILSNGYLVTYNPDDDTWALTPDLPFASTLAANYDKQIAQGTVSRGYFKNGSDVWEFSPENGQWTKLPAFPGGTGNSYDSYSFGLQDDLYIGTSTEDNLWLYKSSQNKWIRKAGITTTYRSSPIYFSIGAKGYVGMGAKSPGDILLKDFNEYNP